MKGIYTPSFVFKRSLHWMEPTVDMRCLHDKESSSNPLLKSYLWRPGPYVWPLHMMLSTKSTLRGNFEKDFQCIHHMGLSAAVHMSSISDPVESWMKRCGVIEQTCDNALTDKLVIAAKNGLVTPELIYRTSLDVFCSQSRRQNMLVPQMDPEFKVTVENSYPWIVKQNPNSFPFLLPGYVTDKRIGGVLQSFAYSGWDIVC